MPFNGTIQSDNDEISVLNKELLAIKAELLTMVGKKALGQEGYIMDFEKFEMEILFSESRKRANLSIENDIITFVINNVTIRIDSNGTIIQ
jgi:RNase P/RNase MRP subunit p29